MNSQVNVFSSSEVDVLVEDIPLAYHSTTNKYFTHDWTNLNDEPYNRYFMLIG